MPEAPGQVVPERLQLAGHQGLGLSQRRLAVLSALLHLLRGCLTVLTTAGTAAEHEATWEAGSLCLSGLSPWPRLG